jgi:RecJ-like exonuclease
MNFMAKIEEEASKLKELLENKRWVRVLSHLDADGLCSGAIIAQMLCRLGIGFHLSTLRQMEKETIKQIAEEKLCILTDLGSFHLREMEKVKGEIFVLDHHQILEKRAKVHLLNPNQFELDGSNQISASGICYLLAKSIDERNRDLIELAIVGAVGDRQVIGGELVGLNRQILEEGVRIGEVEVRRGLRIFGRLSKPIYRALEHCIDPYIPGVSGNESGTVQFLASIGIEARDGDRLRRLCDLSEEEQKKLVSAIVMRRIGLAKPEDVLGEIYRLRSFEDANEAATLLNSCGRLGYPGIGLALAMGDKQSYSLAEKVVFEYRNALLRSLEWIEKNLENPEVVQQRKAIYLICKDQVSDLLIGTLCSILLGSKDWEVVVGFAESDGRIKVSLRTRSKLNLGKIAMQIAMEKGWEGGGHKNAAGLLIPKGCEKVFIEIFERKIGEKHEEGKALV